MRKARSKPETTHIIHPLARETPRNGVILPPDTVARPALGRQLPNTESVADADRVATVDTGVGPRKGAAVAQTRDVAWEHDGGDRCGGGQGGQEHVGNAVWELHLGGREVRFGRVMGDQFWQAIGAWVALG